MTEEDAKRVLDPIWKEHLRLYWGHMYLYEWIVTAMTQFADKAIKEFTLPSA